jgi:hypothetical protein
MRWHISIFSADGTLLFASQCRDRSEAYNLAAEARKMRPECSVYLRDYTGRSFMYEEQPNG